MVGWHIKKRKIGGKRGEHIAAPGQEKPVKSFGIFFYIRSIRKNHRTAARLFQGDLIVFMEIGRTYDSDFFHERLLWGFLWYDMRDGRNMCT